jgi:hypothetical protein
MVDRIRDNTSFSVTSATARSAEVVFLALDSVEPLPPIDSVTPPQLSLEINNREAFRSSGFIEDEIGTQFDAHCIETATGKIWVQGDCVLCPCPDCHAPMSVRFWLMIADCWQCGASVELTQEQQQAVRQWLDEQDKHPPLEKSPRQEALNSPAAPAAKRPAVKVPVARKLDAVAKAVAAPKSRTETLPERRTTAQRPQRIKRFQLGPAWVVSLLLHLLVLLLLALITFTPREDWETITLSTFVSTEDTEGGDVREVDLKQERQDDLPRPSLQDLDQQQIQERLARADQDARELQVDPMPTVPLPNLGQVRDRIAGEPGSRPIFAARDPRLRSEMVEREGGTLLTEAAVSRGLRWLAENQNRDGSWSLANYQQSDRPDNSGDAAGTALALLPFLGAGQTHEYGIYKENVAKGLRWLIERQAIDGDLRAGLNDVRGMYAHGQATIVLVEALAMTGDERFRGPAQLAVDFIVEAQHDEGGWRYRPGEMGDTSVLGWQLMALQSARAPGTGLRVPDTALKLASYYLDLASEEEGALYRYQPQQRQSPTPSMTAEALLCRIYLGWTRDDPRLRTGMDWLWQKHPPQRTEGNLYYWYYGTQLFHHLGGDSWDQWNTEMRDLLVNTQEKRGTQAGSWSPDKFEYGRQGGRIYTTALAVCILEVYYRHLPLFKQLEIDG